MAATTTSSAALVRAIASYANCTEHKSTCLVSKARSRFPSNKPSDKLARRQYIKREAFCWKHGIVEPKTETTEEPVAVPDEERGMLQCRACSSYRVQTFQRQTRSADEGFTIFAKCMDCHKSWKQG